MYIFVSRLNEQIKITFSNNTPLGRNGHVGRSGSHAHPNPMDQSLIMEICYDLWSNVAWKLLHLFTRDLGRRYEQLEGHLLGSTTGQASIIVVLFCILYCPWQYFKYNCFLQAYAGSSGPTELWTTLSKWFWMYSQEGDIEHFVILFQQLICDRGRS